LNAATCANLLDSGTNGLQPEVARRFPTVKLRADVSFRMPAGLRFSPPSNEPVTAATFRYRSSGRSRPIREHTYYDRVASSD